VLLWEGKRKKKKQNKNTTPKKQAGSCTTAQVSFSDFKKVPSRTATLIFQMPSWLFKPTLRERASSKH